MRCGRPGTSLMVPVLARIVIVMRSAHVQTYCPMLAQSFCKLHWPAGRYGPSVLILQFSKSSLIHTRPKEGITKSADLMVLQQAVALMAIADNPTVKTG